MRIITKSTLENNARGALSGDAPADFPPNHSSISLLNHLEELRIPYSRQLFTSGFEVGNKTRGNFT